MSKLFLIKTTVDQDAVFADVKHPKGNIEQEIRSVTIRWSFWRFLGCPEEITVKVETDE